MWPATEPSIKLTEKLKGSLTGKRKAEADQLLATLTTRRNTIEDAMWQNISAGFARTERMASSGELSDSAKMPKGFFKWTVEALGLYASKNWDKVANTLDTKAGALASRMARPPTPQSPR